MSSKLSQASIFAYSIPISLKRIWRITEGSTFKRDWGYVNKYLFDRYVAIRTIDGSGKFIINENEYIVEKDSIFIFVNGTAPIYYTNGDFWDFYWIDFSTTNLSMPINKVYKVPPIDNEVQLFQKCFNELPLANKSKTISSLFAYIFSCWQENLTQEKFGYANEIKEVITLIGNNYHNKDFSIEDMASYCGLTSRQFRTVFKQNVGITPCKFMTNYRLAAAIEMLASQASINVIAGEVGIDNQHYLTKLFKEKYHMTPSEYKKNLKL